jgi:hypothetical protein
VCQNLRFAAGTVTVAHDWDSLVGLSEPVLAGLAAGAHTEGSRTGAGAPTPDEVAAFLANYDDLRATPFTDAQQRAAAGAATWVLACNARCGVSSDHPPADGSRSACSTATATPTSGCGGKASARATPTGPAIWNAPGLPGGLDVLE